MSRIPKEWQIKELEKVIDYILDYRGKTPKKSDSGIPTLSAKSVKNNYIDYEEVYYISDEEYSKFMSRGLPQVGDVLLTMEAPLGLTTLLDRDDVGLAQRIVTINGKRNLLDNRYLKFYFQSQFGQHELQTKATGTTVMGISQKNLRKMHIILPSYDEQVKIAKLLSSFDDKIENNNAIIANLEEQAKTIFKSWFVDFEPFQDEEFVDSELGRIPRNWRIATLKEFFPVVTGKKNANIATENGKFPFFTCAQDISYTDDFSFDDHAILVAGNGDFNVKRFKGKFEAYQRTYVLIPSDENLTGLLYHLINHYLKNIVSGYKGSVINYITKGMIEDFKFPFPNKIEEVGIVDVFNTIEKKIAYTKRENIKLEEIRDTLLPKLMSGEIRVEEAIEAEEM